MNKNTIFTWLTLAVMITASACGSPSTVTQPPGATEISATQTPATTEVPATEAPAATEAPLEFPTPEVPSIPTEDKPSLVFSETLQEGFQAFIDAYRSLLPYDATGNDHAARLTIDVAAGDRWLIALNRHATANWLTTTNPVLDYANAMVGGTSSGSPTDWQEHIDGKPQYSPPVPPLAPAKFTGGLYLKGNIANCNNFDSSEQKRYANYVQTVAPNGAGTTSGMLGFMFWAAEYPSARRSYVATIPPNTCEGGMGVAATTFNIPIPMPPLRQQ